jgi:predicted DNA-binding transcriptional regulator AlpA
MTNQDETLTPEQVAKKLQVSVKEVWRYMGEGLPFIILSPRKRRIPVDGYESWKQYRTITQHGDVPREARLMGSPQDDRREAEIILRSNCRPRRSKSGQSGGANVSCRDAVAEAVGGKRVRRKHSGTRQEHKGSG